MKEFLQTKEEFILKNVAGDYLVFPSGKSIVDFKIMLTLNETGAWIWNKLEKGINREDLIKEFAENNQIDESLAQEDIEIFVSQLKEENLLEKY